MLTTTEAAALNRERGHTKETTMNRTPAQRERQQSKHRSNGQYAKVNPCRICGKSAGIDYLSDPRSDSTDSAGNEWNDEALCLCEKCAPKLAAMPDDEAYKVITRKAKAPWLTGR